QIYEGTNGIQAMDLLGRKLGMKKGGPFMDYLAEMQKTIEDARAAGGLDEISARVEKAVSRLGEVASILGKEAASENVLKAFSFAHPFLDVTGEVTMAWMHLWRAEIASRKLEKLAGSTDKEKILEKAGKNKDAAFYLGCIKTAEFFVMNMLPAAMGKLETIAAGNASAVEMPEASFGG
ncbi:MAG: acyl-CoA dehydrogenase, partial [Desulfosalsimonas sp.]